MSQARDVVVIGGGIAGLSAAWRLVRAGLDATVLEAASEAGGNIRTHSDGGFRYERGPHTFLGSADDVFALADEVGLSDRIVPTRPAAGRRFIARNGRLHEAPTGPGSFLATRLLSWRAKLALAGEPFRTRRGDPGETAQSFFERRFGVEAARVIAGAFISGVYAGDPATLSAPAAFPLFWRFEQESGGMIRGFVRHAKQRKAERRARGESGPARKGLWSLRDGLGELTGGIAVRLGDRVRTGATVRSIERVADGYRVAWDGGEAIASRVVVAAPPQEAAGMLAALDPDLSALLAGIVMAPVTVVHLGFSARAAQVPEGFGFLAPRGEGVRSLGVLFPSRLFDGRADGGGDLLSGYVGGVLDAAALDLDDDTLAAIVRDDLRALIGLADAPSFVRVARTPRAIPQFTLGHLDRMAGVRARLEGLPGLVLAGNYLRGVGLKDAVASGFEAAARLAGGDADGRDGP